MKPVEEQSSEEAGAGEREFKDFLRKALNRAYGEAGAFSTASVPGGAGRIRIGVLSSDAETV